VAYTAGKTHIQRVGNGAPDFDLAADASARRLPTLPLLGIGASEPAPVMVGLTDP